MDRIILIASFFRIFISIGSLTIKHRARLLMNKDINKKIVKKSLVRENEKLVKKFFNDKEST